MRNQWNLYKHIVVFPSISFDVVFVIKYKIRFKYHNKNVVPRFFFRVCFAVAKCLGFLNSGTLLCMLDRMETNQSCDYNNSNRQQHQQRCVLLCILYFSILHISINNQFSEKFRETIFSVQICVVPIKLNQNHAHSLTPIHIL